MHQLTTGNRYCKSVLLCLVLFASKIASAQLKADFTIDKASGCSPLTVSFTNTSTGTSGSTTYKWDFGNGNSSVLPSAGATYKDEKTYTVTLTVKDGAQTVSKSATITVYKKPTVAFSASIAKGCMPLPVSFNSSSTAGDGTISNHFWDFGDGNTQQSQNQNQISHTYNFAQKASVSLTVTNSHGCVNTLEKPNMVDVLPALKAEFSANKTVLCKETDAVNFINKTTGPGNISYSWDFGDGKTSTQDNPTYTYNKKGVYTVKISAKNEDGCTANATQTNYINVANFTTDFSVPQLVCKGTAANFISNSTPTPTYATWSISDGGYPYSTSNAATYTFNTTGTYKVKLINNFGGCEETVEKTVTVKDAPNVQDFIADMNGVCGAPVTIKFKENTTSAVKWEWDFNYNYYSFDPDSKEQAPSYTYQSNGYYTAALRATNTEGCSSPIFFKSLHIYKPTANIYYLSSTSPSGSSGCPGFKMKFAASSSDEITEYKWDFGNGITSTDKTPEVTFNTEGTFTVKLNFTTKDGCKEVAEYYSVQVYKKPKADFISSSGYNICGNTPVIFNDKSTGPVTSWIWNFGDGRYDYNLNLQNPAHQYYDEGNFTVKLIVANGSCYDTVEKQNYIQVTPPFPKISYASNTCDGTRGEVTFQQTSKKATKWVWDFGDGTGAMTLNEEKSEVKHTYTKTGTYKVVLTTSNGQCSVRDSTTVYVLLKQSPDISSTLSSVCGSSNLNFTISGLENNPYPNTYYSHYYFEKFEYGDGTVFNGNNSSSSNYYWTTTYNGTLSGLENGKENMRAILRSYYFGCTDTTDYLPLKIKGPTAGFKVEENSLCFKTPLTFIDTSKGRNGVAIKKWEWDFGDGKTETATKGGSVKHQYVQPGGYYVGLKVTDDEGCTASLPYYTNYVQASGPKAGISTSATSVLPNTTVDFFNNSNNYNSYNTQYKWLNSDGSSSTNYYNISKYYTNVGTDTVKLIATNASNTCADTAMQVIYIRNVTAAFTFTTRYINNNNCPPLVAYFTSGSTNANALAWDFGDGGNGGDQSGPSRTYYKPGVYRVVLYAYGENNAMDSAIEYLTVKGPYARLKADTLFGCHTLDVTLSAEVLNATSYTWDLGDGTLKQTQDTFAIHKYLTPGIYTPSLIMKDASGCSATYELGNKVVIDSLNIAIKGIPMQICDSAEVFFDSDIKSIAAEQMQQTLLYHWDFGTGVAKDSSDIRLPSFKYLSKGKYEVKLKVASPYGCEAEQTETVTIFETVKGSIGGPSGICEGGSALFKGSASSSDPLKWVWYFGNGSTSSSQNPEVQVYKDPGNYPVQLVVEHDGCRDTSSFPLSVHAKPSITILPQQPVICLGNSIELAASGGVAYSWTPATKLSNSTIANPIASPEYTSNYSVTVTNEHGCVNADSVTVTVARPFKMNVNNSTFVCTGKSVQLKASGAAAYMWTDVNRELSDTTIANPVATPNGSTRYTVTGFDAYQCFTDQAEVEVTVYPRPTINAGADIEMLTGDSRRLQPTVSNDVKEWNWSPGDYLSCTSCATPTVLPRKPMTYTVSVKNEYGCENLDTVQIKLLCSDAYIFIPNAFTPNNDQKNAVFYIKGKGVSIVKSMRIFNRWGALMFEKKNFYMDDRSSAWDGKYNGKLVPVGSYVYVTELQCDGGDVFTRQGTVTVIY